MPFTFATLGIAQGLFFTVLTSLMGVFSLSLLSLSAHALKSRNVTFNALSRVTYPATTVVMDVAVAVNCFGVGVSYLIVGMIWLVH